jgi:hypothetical protein
MEAHVPGAVAVDALGEALRELLGGELLGDPRR